MNPLLTTVCAALLAAACASCGTSPANGDAALDDAASDAPSRDATTSDAAPNATLAVLCDRVMSPAYSSTPASLSVCVGGVAVIVTPSDTLVRGYGATELGGNSVPSGSTLFAVGSVSKIFTGFALARLEEEGRIRSDATADGPLADDVAAATTTWPTMRALISHHSGLPDMPSNLVDRDGDGRRDPSISPLSPAAEYSRQNLIDALRDFRAPPSAPYAYSNLGIGVAALAIQDLLGAPDFHAVLRSQVTTDLAMNETWGELTNVPAEARTRIAQGYAVQGPTRVAGTIGTMGVLGGAGAVVTTGDDLAKLLSALTGRTRTALEPAFARATASAGAGPTAGREVGYAIEIEQRATGPVFRKPGATPSYTAYILWSRTPAIGVAVLSSCGSFSATNMLAQQLFDAVAAQP